MEQIDFLKEKVENLERRYHQPPQLPQMMEREGSNTIEFEEKMEIQKYKIQIKSKVIKGIDCSIMS